MDRFPWGFPVWGLIAWLASLLAAWWGSARHALIAATAASPVDAGALRIATAVALGARLLAWAGEAGFYVMAWRASGRRLPYLTLLFWLATVSVVDLFADATRRLALAHGAIAPAWALLLGPGVLAAEPAAATPAAAAFGSAGALTLVRILGTAHVQARLLAIGHVRPLAFTLGAWLASRAALWWLADLARGRSLLP